MPLISNDIWYVSAQGQILPYTTSLNNWPGVVDTTVVILQVKKRMLWLNNVPEIT